MVLTALLKGRLNPIFIGLNIVLVSFIIFNAFSHIQNTQLPSVITGKDMYTICNSNNCKSFPYEINPQAGDNNLMDIPKEYGTVVNIFANREDLDRYNSSQMFFFWSYVVFALVYSLIAAVTFYKNKILLDDNNLTIRTFLLGYNPPKNLQNFLHSESSPYRFKTTSEALISIEKVEKIYLVKHTKINLPSKNKIKIGFFDEILIQYKDEKGHKNVATIEVWLFPSIKGLVMEILSSDKHIKFVAKDPRKQKGVLSFLHLPKLNFSHT